LFNVFEFASHTVSEIQTGIRERWAVRKLVLAYFTIEQAPATHNTAPFHFKKNTCTVREELTAAEGKKVQKKFNNLQELSKTNGVSAVPLIHISTELRKDDIALDVTSSVGNEAPSHASEYCSSV